MSFPDFADIDEQCAKDKQLKREDISNLEEWQIKQPHLPSPLHPIETALFLHSCFYRNEAAKQCIENYYTLRTLCPDMFANRNPLSQELQFGMNTFSIMPLPDLTPEGNFVLYGHLLNRNPDAFNLNTMWKMMDMITSLALRQRGCQKGFVIVMNLEGTTVSHLLKCGLTSVKNALTYFQMALPVRIHAFHFTNCVTFMDKIMVMIKPFLGKDLKDKFHMHFGDNSTIFQSVPKNMLPIECGGESFCAEDYYKNFARKEIETHSEFFQLDERQLADESKRPGKPKNIANLCGMQGTFKKLDLD